MGMSGVDGTGAAAARFLEPRRLQPGEELGSFSCSVELIDDWAAKHASYAAKQEPRFRTYASPQTGMSQAFMR